MVADNLPAITLNDFRPGIFSEYHATGSVTPSNTAEGSVSALGAATIENTYRCCADRSGALVPLPKLVAGPTATPLTGNTVTDRDAAYLLDAIVLTDMYVETEIPAVVASRPAVFVMFGQWVQTDNYRWTVVTRMYRLFDDAGSQDLMFAKGSTNILSTDTTKAHIGAGNFTVFRARANIDSLFTYQSVAWNAFGAPDYGSVEPAWVTGAMSVGDQALTNFDSNNGANYPAATSGRILGLFPDYDNISTAQTKFLSDAGMTGASLITVHQGRLIAAGREHGDFGENTAGDTLGLLTEHIHYTPPYDFDASLGIGELEFGTFGERRPHLSGVVASVSADELLLIKYKDGGLVVRGDLDDPTQVDLPFLHSTGGARCVPAWTPLGLVYGTVNGVYVWEGGETTKSISPQIEGWFWQPDPDAIERYGTHGRFAWWEPFVVAPNNYLFDTRGQGWWRLDQTDSNGTNVPILAADVAPNGHQLYVFPYALIDTDSETLWFTAQQHVLADTYSWQSQPLAQTIDRFVTVRELKLLATHTGSEDATVTITLTGFTEDGEAITPVTHAFTLNDDHGKPQLKVASVSCGPIAYVQVRIQVDANDTGDPAPKIHSLSLAVSDRQRIPSA